MNMKIVSCLAPLAFIAAMPAAAEEGASQLQTFTKNVRAYVPFDATATVTVECPDPAAAKWLEAHFREWYGDYAPKVERSTLNFQLKSTVRMMQSDRWWNRYRWRRLVCLMTINPWPRCSL